MHAKTAHIAVLLSLGIGAASSRILAQNAPERKDSAQMSAIGVHTVVVRTEAGALRLIGDSSTSEITARATLRASSPDYLSELALRLERRADTVFVYGEFPRVGHGSDFDVAAAIDILLTLPPSIAVASKSTMGSVSAAHLASVSIEHRLGDVTVEHIRGNVRVIDYLGAVRVVDVDGGVHIPKGSGHARISDVKGGVDVQQYDIGPLDIKNVSRDVHIGSMRSGFITVSHVGGDLSVEHLHFPDTYSIRFQDVSGNVTVPTRVRR